MNRNCYKKTPLHENFSIAGKCSTLQELHIYYLVIKTIMKYQLNFRAKSMISSHVKCLLTSQVKRSLLLWLYSKIALIIVYHVYNCFIFHWCYTINSILHGRWEMRNSSSPVEKNFTHALRLLVKYFSTLEEKSRSSVQPCYILYLLIDCSK